MPNSLTDASKNRQAAVIDFGRARLERKSIAFDEALAACHANPCRENGLRALQAEAEWEAAVAPYCRQPRSV